VPSGGGMTSESPVVGSLWRESGGGFRSDSVELVYDLTSRHVL